MSQAAAVLALNSLRVHSATVNSHEGVAITEFVVSPHFGSPAAPDLLRQQFVGALAGDIDVLAMVEKRSDEAASSRAGEVQAGVPVTRSTAPPHVVWLDTAAEGRLILEVRAMDRPGLLALLTRALERAGADIGWAKVHTFGSTAADVFCVELPTDVPEEPGAQAAVEKQLMAVLGGPGEVTFG